MAGRARTIQNTNGFYDFRPFWLLKPFKTTLKLVLEVLLEVLEVVLQVMEVVLEMVLEVLGMVLPLGGLFPSILACFSSPGHGFARHLVEMKPTDALHLPI